MKKLKFEKLWLLSTQERRARTESFEGDVTTVVADNEFGKSSLVKSLYWTLGADPFKTPESWQNIKAASLLRFSIDEVGITCCAKVAILHFLMLRKNCFGQRTQS